MLNLLCTQRAGVDAHGQDLDVLESAYARYMASLGFGLIPLSNRTPDLGALLNGLTFHGVLLTGGGDVGYDLTRDEFAKGITTFPHRDRFYCELIDYAIKERLPVIAVCYGMQLLNCHLGGRLTFDIHGGDPARTPGRDHRVFVTKPDFWVAAGEYRVNHYHNHGVKADGLADVLEPFATDAGFDVVEGYVHRELPIMGVQWHPERPSPDEGFNRSLITGFLEKHVER